MRTPRLTRLALASVLVVCLAGCGGSATPPSSASGSVLDGTIHSTTFAQVRHAIDTLYATHPAITSFEVQAVEYPPKPRDKVLKVCREGSLANTARELETERVMACAPLIYFFAHYGSEKSVPESTAVARQLYRYAVTHNQHPYSSTKPLTGLLSSWGIK